jgi:hypothetical protein
MSYTAPNPLPYFSHAQTNAAPSNQPRRVYPLSTSAPESVRKAAYAFDQEFEMMLASFPPASRNTVANAAGGATFGLSDANAILTDLGQPSATEGGLGKFTGRFNIVPASWDDYSTQIPYTFADFPGYLGTANVRGGFTDTVTVRQHHDYFVLDPSGTLNGGTVITPGTGLHAGSVNDSGGTAVNLVGALSDIPRVAKTFFYVPYSGVWCRTNSLIRAGGQQIGASLYLETMPTRESYVTMIANVVTSGWGTTAWGGSNTVTGQGQLVIEDSKVVPYAGLIFDRITMYVLAK